MADGVWYEIQQGDYLGKIADSHGIPAGSIWDHPSNASLKKSRDPNVLFPGERLFLPKLQEGKMSRPTNQRHEIRLSRNLNRLELELVDAAGKPIANQKYRLTWDDRVFEGTTSSSGVVKLEKLPHLESASATLTLPEVGLSLQLQPGGLNPSSAGKDDSGYDDGVSGMRARLASLGFELDAESDGSNDDLVGAIALFQRFVMNRPPGEARGELDDETRGAIQSQFGV